MLNGDRTKSGRKRSPRDFYVTPLYLAEAAIMKLLSDELDSDLMSGLDAGCGTGIWGKSIRFMPLVNGIDLNPQISEENSSSYEKIITGDFLEYKERKYDFIFGNPPYSLAEEFIRHSFELLEPEGYIYFLLRLSFLEGIKRERGLFREFPIKKVYVCSRRPSFYSSDGKRHTTDTLAYAMFLWQKEHKWETEISFLNWEYK